MIPFTGSEEIPTNQKPEILRMRNIGNKFFSHFLKLYGTYYLFSLTLQIFIPVFTVY